MIRFGVSPNLSDPNAMLREAILLEKIGFHSIWIADHLTSIYRQTCPEIWSLITAIGLNTKRLVIASGVTDPFRRHPATLAQTVSTIDHLIGGRTVLGIGLGEAMNLDLFGIEHEATAKKIREVLQYILLLWESSTEKTVNFTGQFHSMNEAFLSVNSIQKPHPPIYLGAHGPKNRELAGELCDGWFPFIISPTIYKEYLQDFERGARKADKTLDGFDAVSRFFFSLSDDEESAEKTASLSARKGLILERRVLMQMGFKGDLPLSLAAHHILPRESDISQLEKLCQTIPDNTWKQVSVYGTVDQCIEQIETFVSAGCSHLVITNVSPDREKSLKLFGERIIPYFNK